MLYDLHTQKFDKGCNAWAFNINENNHISFSANNLITK